MRRPVDRRTFLNRLGVTMGAAATATAGSSIIAAVAQTGLRESKVPEVPRKMGHMTFLTGPAAALNEPSLKGHVYVVRTYWTEAAGSYTRGRL